MTIDSFLSRLKGVKSSGHNKFVALCPGHDDKNPSLSVIDHGDSIGLRCFAGCSHNDILNSLGLEKKDIFTKHSNNKGANWVAQYDYYDANNKYVYHIKKSDRIPKKDFSAFHYDNSGIEVSTIKGIERIPYNLPGMLKGIREDKPIFLVEGEKDVDNLSDIGLIATTTPFGAGSWKKEYANYFKGATVIILPDNDDEGRKYANNAYNDLLPVAKYVQIIQLPLEKEHEDVSDWLEKYHDMKKAKNDLFLYIDEKWDQEAENQFVDDIAESISDVFSLADSIKKLALSDIEFAKPLIYFQDLPAVYPNSFTLIQGQKGTYKSNIAQNIASAALAAHDVGGFYKNPADKNDYFVIYIDTERSLKDAFPFAVQTMLKRADLFVGFPEDSFPDDKFLPVSFMPFERNERLGKLEALLKYFTSKVIDKKILVIVDIYPDLMVDFNSPVETDEVIDSALKFINNYDCSIVFTIHENYGTNKAVGHAGSSAVRKSSVHIQLQTDKDGMLDLKFLNIRHHKKQNTAYKLAYDQEKLGLELLKEEEVQSKIEERRDYVISLLTTDRQDKSDIVKKVEGRYNISRRTASSIVNSVEGITLSNNFQVTIEQKNQRVFTIFLTDLNNV